MVYIHTAFNLCIHSEIPLPQAAIAQGAAHVRVRLGNLDSVTPEDVDQGHCLLSDIPGTVKFLIKNGHDIIVEPADGIDAPILSHCILGTCMSVILRQRGFLVLHASSVAINNQAIAFMGASGWGKSTLAEAFHAKGYDILTDDVLAIQFAANHPLVIPSFPQIKLWRDAANSLGHDVETLPPIFPQAPKLAHRFSQGFQQTPLPLNRIYVLAKGTCHEIVPLSFQQAFAELVRHTRSVDALTAPEFVSAHLRQCASLFKDVSFRRFVRQPALADLPELVRLVEDDITQATDQASTLDTSLKPPLNALQSA